MNFTPDISMGNVLTIIVAIAVPTVGFIVSLVVLRTTVALEKKRTDEKIDAVNKRVDRLEEGFEGGIGKVQESLTSLGNVLNEVRTKVEILFDRDERQTPPATSRSRRPKTLP